MEKISNELNYSPVVSNHSTVIFRSVAPHGSASVTPLATASIGPSTFLIPPTVFNPSRSRLNFQLSVAATSGNFTYIQGNTLSIISRIVLYDGATNAVWCDISNLDKYANMVSGAGTPLSEFLTKSYALNQGGVVADANKVPVEDIEKSNVATANDNGSNTDLALSNSYLGQRTFYIGGSNAVCALNVSIPFSAFKFSALATSKNIYNVSNLIMDIYWSPVQNFAFVAASATDPTSTPAAAGAVTISGLQVQLACEQNLSIISQTISKVMSGGGISLPIGYPTITKQSPGATTSPSYQLQLVRGYGERILFIATSFFTSAGTNNTAQVHSNAGDVLTRYNTFINNVALKYPNGFDTSKGEDWIFNNKVYHEKSAVQTLGEWKNGYYLHIDSFFGEKPLCEVDQHEVDGLDVSAQSSTWQIQATTTGTAYDWLTAIVGQKTLSLSNMGSQIV